MMKKWISALSVLLVLTMCFTMVALGSTDSDYEMPKRPLTSSTSKTTGGSNTNTNNDNNTSSDSGLDVVSHEFETDPLPLDVDAGQTTTKKTTTTTKVSIKKCKITGISKKTYTGKAITQKITVKYGSKTLKSGTDYTVAYKNNKKVGTATVTVTGKGKYKDKVSKTFAINPKGVKLSKVTSPKSKQIKATWKKYTTQTTGYQVQCATDKNFSKNKKSVTVSGNKKTNTVVKKLKGKKKYYVRIRTYKTVGKTKYYSSWSAVKTVTTKK